MRAKKKLKASRKPDRNAKIPALPRHEDVPATVGLVNEVRAELVSQIASVDHKVDALSHQVGSLRMEMGALEKRWEGKFEEVRATVQQVLTSVHRTQTLMEEQRSENRIVLDGLKNHSERMDRMEDEASAFRRTLTVLLKTKEKAQ